MLIFTLFYQIQYDQAKKKEYDGFLCSSDSFKSLVNMSKKGIGKTGVNCN